MIFEKDGNVVTLDAPAQYPYGEDSELIQAKDKSASGVTHVESFNVQTDNFTYRFEDTSQQDYAKIMDWFINVAEGMLNTFNLTDDLGTTRLVRFTTAKISFKKNSFGLWMGFFTTEQVT